MEAIKPDSALAAMLHVHGGNLAAARQLFPNAPEPWIDLSTGINPVSYPLDGLSDLSFRSLPQPADVVALEAVAARAWQVGDAARVVAAPGTQAILQLLPTFVPTRRIGILGDTYSGHASAWAAAGREVVQVDAAQALEEFDFGVIVNPNNPDGRSVPLRQLTLIAAKLAARGGTLLVDEAFVEAGAATRSLAPHAQSCGALVLRSFGKIYGLAGLRLGFAVAPPGIAAGLRQALGPWAVSGPALAIGQLALADTAWLAQTQQRLAEDCLRLDSLLRRAGFASIRGTPLFRLARHSAAADLFLHLGAAGILVRPFALWHDRLRFGLPGTPEAWARLAEALRPAG